MRKTFDVRSLLLLFVAESLLLLCMVGIKLQYVVYPYPNPIRDTIETASRETGVPVPIILATIKTESNFLQDAVSTKGAVGLMQLMPTTFTWITGGDREFDIYNEADNILAGSRYLAYLYERYGNWDTAHAAYNAGDGTVDTWLTDARYSEGGVLTNIPYPETATYVRRVNFAKKIYTHLYFK